MVIQLALLVEVQLQPVPAVTVTVPVVAADDVRFDEVGAMVNVQGAPAWVTVKVWPAIVSVPVRDEVLVLAATLYATVPLPVPLVPEVIVIQLALLAPVHVQPVPAVTVTEPVADEEDVRLRDVGEIVGAHGALNANVFDRGVDWVPPGPTDLTTASYTTPGVSGVVSRATKSSRIIPSVPGAGLPRFADETTVEPPAVYTSIA
jgi:hypothetical protein